MKILVCGGRDYNDEAAVNKIMSFIWGLHYGNNPVYKDDLVVVHGAARGADYLAGMYCFLMAIKQIPYPANWNKHGKAAGFIRNQQMLDENSDIKVVIAFPGNNGTADMIKRAEKKGIPIYRVGEKNEAPNIL